MARVNYEYLREFANVRQHEVLDVLDKSSSQQEAANKLGMRVDSLQEHLTRLKKKAAQSGLAPDYDMKHPVPAGFVVKGVSTYYSEDGSVKGQ